MEQLLCTGVYSFINILSFCPFICFIVLEKQLPLLSGRSEKDKLFVHNCSARIAFSSLPFSFSFGKGRELWNFFLENHLLHRVGDVSFLPREK